MSTNKNATIRYQVLDRCFRNPGRRYCMADLERACIDALLEIDSESTGIKRRQVYYDILFMQDSLGFDAPIQKYNDGGDLRFVYYRYEDQDFSINNQPLNEKEAQQLKESLLTLSRFKGMPQFEWVEEIIAKLEQSFNLKTGDNVLSFEENPFLTGRSFISDLYTAIVNKQTLIIEYRPFKRKKLLQFELHPYHLKQYNSRWFLFGFNEKEGTITNIALDRIISINNSKELFKPNTEIDFEQYFEDIIGVTVPNNKPTQKVVLKIDKSLWPYIKTKPLHGSQKIKEENRDYTLIELELLLNYELEALIFSFGEKVEVMAPKMLRTSISNRTIKLNSIYN